MVQLTESLYGFLGLNELSSVEQQELLERHKLGGIFTEIYPSAYQKYWIINTNHLNVLKKEILPLELKACLLKGMHLVSSFYDDIGKRFMGDIDLLINNDDLEKWENSLISIGFEEVKEERWKANDFKKVFIRTKNGMDVAIEIHTRLFFQEEKSLQWDMNPFLGKNISCLNREDLFIHLSGHLAYQHTFHSLNWLYDIALVVNKHRTEFNWEKVFKRARQARVYRSCRIVLCVLNTHFQINSVSFSIFEKLFVKLLVTSNFLKAPYQHKYRYLFIKTLIKDSLWQALKYNIGLLKFLLKTK